MCASWQSMMPPQVVSTHTRQLIRWLRDITNMETVSRRACVRILKVHDVTSSGISSNLLTHSLALTWHQLDNSEQVSV